MKSSQVQFSAVRLSPRALSKSIAGFLRQFAGKTLSVQVLRTLPEGRVLLQAGPHRFEALLRGEDLKAGEGIDVRVRLLADGTIELGVLKEAALSMIEFQALLSQFPQALSQMLSAFLLAKGKGLSKETQKEASLHKGKGEAVRSESLKEEFRWLLPVLEKSRFSDDSEIAMLLRRLLQEGGAKEAQRLFPETCFQETWLVEHRGIEGRETWQEEWNFEAVSKQGEAPAYFFFQVQAGALGGLSGAFLSARNADFSELHVFVRSERPELGSYLRRQAEQYKKMMQEHGIEILEFAVFSETQPPGLDLQA